MKRYFAGFGVIALSMLTAPAFAVEAVPGTDVEQEVTALQEAFSPDTVDARSHRHHHGQSHRRAFAAIKKVCKKVNATDEQKASIMSAALDYKEAAAGFEATVKQAKIRYVRAVLSDAGEVSAANAASAEGIAAKTSLLEAKAGLATKILFDILEKDQRKAGLACLALVAKAKQHIERHISE